jgi:molybdenum cofactor biosynthesis enzyme MoaA
VRITGGEPQVSMATRSASSPVSPTPVAGRATGCLTADGVVRNCLFAADERSARGVMRGDTDNDLADLFRARVWDKLPGHGVNDPGFVQPARPMSRIGG